MLCTAESVDAFIKYIEESINTMHVYSLQYGEQPDLHEEEQPGLHKMELLKTEIREKKKPKVFKTALREKKKLHEAELREKKKPKFEKKKISNPKCIIRYCAKKRKWIKEPPTVYTGPATYTKDENCTG